mgnify:CR=1 FL=1
MSMNCVNISGNLVRDPELRTTNNDKKVCTFPIAVDVGKDASGQRMADFFNVTVWGEAAEALCRLKKKGQYIAVTGRLRNRKWQDKQGNNRVSTEIVAGMLDFGPAVHEQSKQQEAAKEPSAETAGAAYATTPNDDFSDVPESEDLPF